MSSSPPAPLKLGRTSTANDQRVGSHGVKWSSGPRPRVLARLSCTQGYLLGYIPALSKAKGRSGPLT